MGDVRLFLVRHGDYVPEAIDPAKPLSDKGADDVRDKALLLKSKGFSVEQFVHSGKTRALQTAGIFQAVINQDAPITIRESLSPFDNMEDILSYISSIETNTMIVGHAPFLPKLASALVGKEDSIKSMPTSSVIVLKKANGALWEMVDFML